MTQFLKGCHRCLCCHWAPSFLTPFQCLHLNCYLLLWPLCRAPRLYFLCLLDTNMDAHGHSKIIICLLSQLTTPHFPQHPGVIPGCHHHFPCYSADSLTCQDWPVFPYRHFQHHLSLPFCLHPSLPYVTPCFNCCKSLRIGSVLRSYPFSSSSTMIVLKFHSDQVLSRPRNLPRIATTSQINNGGNNERSMWTQTTILPGP